MDNIEQLSIAIKEILSLKGISVFQNSKLFCAMLDDLAPKLLKERKVFRRILDDKILIKIGNLASDESAIQNSSWSRIEYELLNDYGVSSEWCNVIVLSFSIAFGQEYDKQQSRNDKEKNKKDLKKIEVEDFQKKNNLKEVKEKFVISINEQEYERYNVENNNGIETVKQENSNITISKIHKLSADNNDYNGIMVVNKYGTVDVYNRVNAWKWGHNCKKALKNWNNIIEIVSGGLGVVGLKSDGTVVSFAGNAYRLNDITNQNALYNTEKWKGIVQIAAGWGHTVGLRKDGTVVAIMKSDKYNKGQCEVNNWQNIVQISAAKYGTVGLKSNGTLVFAGEIFWEHNEYLKNWNNLLGVTLICVDIFDLFVIAINKYHKIIACSKEIEEQLNSWENIVQIYSHRDMLIGVCFDGSIVTKKFITLPIFGDKYLQDLYINRV